MSSAFKKHKLAIITPLPPERSGISDYSAELIPYLSRYYDIDVIVNQKRISANRLKKHCHIINIETFYQKQTDYDRVLYHFGNSLFHQHMIEMFDDFPGVVVLHDFYLTDMLIAINKQPDSSINLASKAYLSHGYPAFLRHVCQHRQLNSKLKFPINLPILANSLGIIIHSQTALELAKYWYDKINENYWEIIPLLRKINHKQNKTKARKALKLSKNSFIVCSFGMLVPIKMCHRLVKAWANSEISKQKNNKLIFVGNSSDPTYMTQLNNLIESFAIKEKVILTGWVNKSKYRQYLAAANIAVQLRSFNHGEVSAALMDCLNYSLPTIVNTNANYDFLPEQTFFRICENFCDDELTVAIDQLGDDRIQRKELSQNARNYLIANHSPRLCAIKYFNAIEKFYYHRNRQKTVLEKIISCFDNQVSTSNIAELPAPWWLASLPIRQTYKQLFIDVSIVCREDYKTGVQRVCRALLYELIINPPDGYRVEPVMLYDELDPIHYKYARSCTKNFFNYTGEFIDDEPIFTQKDDVILVPDQFFNGIINAKSYFETLKQNGVKIYFLLHDLLPVLSPHTFPAEIELPFRKWLEIALNYNGICCISRSVAEELQHWIKQNRNITNQNCNISWFHLGADMENSIPSTGISESSLKIIGYIKHHISFLMVGTVEPRKGYRQTLEAFEQLWKEGLDINLIIIGNTGWMVESLIKKIRTHPEHEKRLFWLEGISDEDLTQFYKHTTCLIAASEGEGFGLPLIEAAKYNLPILARDIPVFREIAADTAFYFSGSSPFSLAIAIHYWISLYQTNQNPKPHELKWQTWKDSTQELLSKII